MPFNWQRTSSSFQSSYCQSQLPPACICKCMCVCTLFGSIILLIIEFSTTNFISFFSMAINCGLIELSAAVYYVWTPKIMQLFCYVYAMFATASAKIFHCCISSWTVLTSKKEAYGVPPKCMQQFIHEQTKPYKFCGYKKKIVISPVADSSLNSQKCATFCL